jgi:hypothetical protein
VSPSSHIRKYVLAYCKVHAVVRKAELEHNVGAMLKANQGLAMFPGAAWTEALHLLATGRVEGMAEADRLGVSEVRLRAPAEESDTRQIDMWEDDE